MRRLRPAGTQIGSGEVALIDGYRPVVAELPVEFDRLLQRLHGAVDVACVGLDDAEVGQRCGESVFGRSSRAMAMLSPSKDRAVSG